MESDPEAFTKLARALGVSSSLAFVDAFLEDGKIITFTEDKPVHALILIFPANSGYEKEKTESERTREVYTASGADEPVIWFKQTINNACGLYAILHSVVNGSVSRSIRPGSLLSNLLQSTIPLPPFERARVLEDSNELEVIYKSIALENPSAKDINPEDEVDYHYIAFVRGSNGVLFEMDGDTDKGPRSLGSSGDESLASNTTIQEVLKQYLERGALNEFGFSLLALVGET